MLTTLLKFSRPRLTLLHPEVPKKMNFLSLQSAFDDDIFYLD
jgi:hypothetical protein